jgi:hypothetical protein
MPQLHSVSISLLSSSYIPLKMFPTIDWQNFLVSINVIWRPQRYSPRRIIRDDLVDSHNDVTTVWLHNSLGRINLLQDWRRTSPSGIHETYQRREFRIQPISTIIMGQSWWRSPCYLCRSVYGSWIFEQCRDLKIGYHIDCILFISWKCQVFRGTNQIV